MDSKIILNAILYLWMISLNAALHSTSHLNFCGSDGAGPIVDHGQIGYTNYSTQAIVPEMRLNFSGYITGWSARTLIITLPNYVETLTHAITFQVWRPSTPTNPVGYTLVGSNTLSFESNEIRPGLIDNPLSNTTSYFNFTNKEVPNKEQIRFSSGDIIGWKVSTDEIGITSPLSVLYKAKNPGTHCVIHEYSNSNSDQHCRLCSGQGANSVASASPFVSIHYVRNQVQESCSISIEECEASSNKMPNSKNVTEPGNSAPDTGQQSDCQGAVALGIAILVAVALIFVIQVVVCVICIFTLVRLKRQSNAPFLPSDNSTVPLRIFPTPSDDEYKIQDLIGHNDNKTYQPATGNNTSSKTTTSAATYEEIPTKK